MWSLARKTYRLLKEEPAVVSKWQMNLHLSGRGGSSSCLQTILSNLPSGIGAATGNRRFCQRPPSHRCQTVAPAMARQATGRLEYHCPATARSADAKNSTRTSSPAIVSGKIAAGLGVLDGLPSAGCFTTRPSLRSVSPCSRMARREMIRAREMTWAGYCRRYSFQTARRIHIIEDQRKINGPWRQARLLLRYSRGSSKDEYSPVSPQGIYPN